MNRVTPVIRTGSYTNITGPAFTVECGLGENPLPIAQFERIYKDNVGILAAAALEAVRG